MTRKMGFPNWKVHWQRQRMPDGDLCCDCGRVASRTTLMKYLCQRKRHLISRILASPNREIGVRDTIRDFLPSLLRLAKTCDNQHSIIFLVNNYSYYQYIAYHMILIQSYLLLWYYTLIVCHGLSHVTRWLVQLNSQHDFPRTYRLWTSFTHGLFEMSKIPHWTSCRPIYARLQFLEKATPWTLNVQRSTSKKHRRTLKVIVLFYPVAFKTWWPQFFPPICLASWLISDQSTLYTDGVLHQRSIYY